MPNVWTMSKREDFAQAALRVVATATGTLRAALAEEDEPVKNIAAVALGRLGGRARAKALGSHKRRAIAKAAAAARWGRR